MIKEGVKAPEFSLPDGDGKKVSLKDFRGKKIVLYFYPKDFTPGCTIEACSFRDHSDEFEKKGAIVLGISVDDVKSHAKFKEKHDLPFKILSDVGAKICAKYGVWKEKNFMGKKYMGIERTTFLIDEKGKIEKVFRKVQPLNHWKEIFQAL